MMSRSNVKQRAYQRRRAVLNLVMSLAMTRLQAEDRDKHIRSRCAPDEDNVWIVRVASSSSDLGNTWRSHTRAIRLHLPLWLGTALSDAQQGTLNLFLTQHFAPQRPVFARKVSVFLHCRSGVLFSERVDPEQILKRVDLERYTRTSEHESRRSPVTALTVGSRPVKPVK